MAEKEKNTYESEVLPKARSKSRIYQKIHAAENSGDCPDLYPVHGNHSDFWPHDGTL